MDKKLDFSSITEAAGRTAKDLWDKAKSEAIKAVDQNGDGKLDMSDLTGLISSFTGSSGKSEDSAKDAQ